VFLGGVIAYHNDVKKELLGGWRRRSGTLRSRERAGGATDGGGDS